MDRAALPDDALLEAFQAARSGGGWFGHREHVRAAFLFLTREPDFGVAAVRFREALRRFAAAQGAAARFHETLTWAYLALINERAHGTSFANSSEFVARHPELLDQKSGALSRYYDVAAVARSVRARVLFLLPEPAARGPGG
jgi:hypothetical protein